MISSIENKRSLPIIRVQRYPGHNAHFNALAGQIHLFSRDKMRIGMIPILIMMRENTSLRHAQCWIFVRQNIQFRA